MRKSAAMCFVLGFGVGIAQAAFAQGRPALVNVETVTLGPMTQTIPVLGRFVPLQTGVVAALTRGPVSKILVDVGDRVSRGDILVQLVTASLQAESDLRTAELSEKQAELDTARAQLGVSQRELERLEGLKASVAFSLARFEDKLGQVKKYKSEVAESNAAIARARANLRLVNIELNNTAILAPYAGVVAERHTIEGAYLNTGNAVVTLINDKDLEIEADISSVRVRGLKIGRMITAVLEDGSRYKARVRAVVPLENTRTRTRPVRFVPELASDAVDWLVANQSVTLLIPVGEDRDVISVHKDAVVLRSDGAIVFVVIDGRASQRRVSLGESIGNRFEVLEGLSAGESVVVRGNERLLPGQALSWPRMPRPEANPRVETGSAN